MSNLKRTLLTAAHTAVALLLFGGCSSNASQNEHITLRGAGATAPYLIYSKWVEAYRREEPQVDLEYKPAGSGQGLAELKANRVDFSGSDIPLTDEEMAAMPVKPLHFPTLVGAIVPVYNVPKAGTLK